MKQSDILSLILVSTILSGCVHEEEYARNLRSRPLPEIATISTSTAVSCKILEEVSTKTKSNQRLQNTQRTSAPMIDYSCSDQDGKLSTQIDFNVEKLENFLQTIAPWAIGTGLFLLTMLSILTGLLFRTVKWASETASSAWKKTIWGQPQIESYLPREEDLSPNDRTIMASPQSLAEENESHDALTQSGPESSYQGSVGEIDALKLEGALHELASRQARIETRMEEVDCSLAGLAADQADTNENLAGVRRDMNDQNAAIMDKLDGLETGIEAVSDWTEQADPSLYRNSGPHS